MGTVESYDTAKGRRWRVRYRTPDRRQTSKRGFPTKREAERYLATVEVSKIRGEWVDPTRARVDVAAVAREWINAQVQVKPSTLSGYQLSLDRYVLPAWGDRRLTEVGHGEVQAWVSALSEKLAPSTVRQVYFVLAAIMKFAIRDGRITRDPTDGIQLPRDRPKRRGYLDHGQVRVLSDACGEYSDLVTFLAYTGLRWGECAALRVKSIDQRRARVHVEESLTDVRGELIRGTPKTHEQRSVPIPGFVLTLIAARLDGRGLDEPLFATARGLEMRGGNFRRRIFNPALADVQEQDPTFPTITVHDLRHTAASLAVSAGANVKTVQRMLGHSSAAMTLDVYADLFDDDLDAVAIQLDKAARESVSKLWPETLDHDSVGLH